MNYHRLFIENSPWAHGGIPGRIILMTVMAVIVLSVGNISPAQAEYEGHYPYKVGTTVGMIADIVKAVGGDKTDVTNIIGTGVDPHLFNPTRSDVAVLMKSDIIFYNGLLLEGQMADILVKVARRKPVFAVTEELEESFLLQDTESKHADPHVWMDVQGWMAAVAVVRDAFVSYDPPNADAYRERSEAYLGELKKLDEYARKVIGSIPEKQRIMVTAHDAFRYLGRAYEIEVMGIQGLSTESEAGLKDINRIVGELVDRKIPAVFVETSVSDKNVKALIEGAGARGHAVRIGGALFSDAMGKPGSYEGTYIGMIDNNVTLIARALGGQAPEKGMQGKLSAAK